MNDSEHKAVGVGGQLFLIDDKIIIKRKGIVGFLSQGLKGDKEILISSISSIQFKAAGVVTSGYIQFSFLGGQEAKGGIFQSTQDENSVLFTKAAQPQFEKLKALIEERRKFSAYGQATSTVMSSAEQLVALSKLRTEGLLSEDEFQSEKAKVLRRN
jgi:hypothetical protein